VITASLYSPRATPLHRLPAWLKLLALAVGAVVIGGRHSVAWESAALALCLVALASTQPNWGPVLRTLRMFAVFALIGIAFHWWLGDPARGAAIGLAISAVVVLSLAVTASTPSDDVIDVIAWILRPLRRWVPTEIVGLMFGLMVRAVPEAQRIYLQSAQAAAARGRRHGVTATVIPTGIRTVGYALAVGDALAARGIGEEVRLEAAHAR